MAKLDANEIDEIAPGTVIDGRYKVLRSIGQGGSGMVYEVEHARTGRRLALKALLENAGLPRLEQEARAASLMKNGHTAAIVDMEFGQHGGFPRTPGGPTGAYMVMELLDGQSLRALLEDAGQLPLELTVNIAMQVCECLHEAHGLGIIHRDLKPENIFLCRSPWPGQHDVKVLDFGVMKIADGGSAIPKSSLTRTGSTVGTPYYMSLEQLRNSSAVDARADVYSLGVVLYECLSGRKPFQAETIGDLVYALCSGPPTQISRLRPDLPADVTELVMRTLSANRDERPARMIDLALALLPHANQAFSLWVKVDGKQPALSLVSPSSAGAGPRPAGGDPRSPGPPRPVPRPPEAAAPRPPPRPAPSDEDGTATKPFAQRSAPPNQASPQSPVTLGTAPLKMGAAPPSPVAATAADAPSPASTSHAGGPRLADPADAGGRRDTPTEMFVKGVHGSGPYAEESDGGGDRDTPTRAIALDAMTRAPFTTGSPGGAPPLEDDPHPEGGTIDLSKAIRAAAMAASPPSPAFGAQGYGAPANAGPSSSAAPIGTAQTVPASFLGGVAQPPSRPAVLHPGAAEAKLTMPLGYPSAPTPVYGASPGAFGAPPPQIAAPDTVTLAPAPANPAAMEPLPPKPAWQVQLDRMLVTVGRFGEQQARRYREAPQNTQIVVMIVAGTIVILMIGSVIFVALR